MWGVLVPDMEEAAAKFSEVLGLTFKDPAVAHVDRFEQKSRVEVLDLRITWSVEGPPLPGAARVPGQRRALRAGAGGACTI